MRSASGDPRSNQGSKAIRSRRSQGTIVSVDPPLVGFVASSCCQNREIRTAVSGSQMAREISSDSTALSRPTRRYTPVISPASGIATVTIPLSTCGRASRSRSMLILSLLGEVV